MDYILDYLCDPRKAGVFEKKFFFAKDGAAKFHAMIEKRRKDAKIDPEYKVISREKRDTIEADRLSWRSLWIEKTVFPRWYSIPRSDSTRLAKEIFMDLKRNLEDFCVLSKIESVSLPKSFENWVYLQKRFLDQRFYDDWQPRKTVHYKTGTAQVDIPTRFFIAEPFALPTLNDAMFVEFSAPKDCILKVTSVKKDCLSAYSSFLESIPIIKQNLTSSSLVKRHSSSYCLNPYASAVSLWGSKVALEKLPEHLVKFFEGSLNYFGHEEWRTSILISAIIVESILADMYEEEFHEPAPDESIGKLLNKIENDIPNNILKAVRLTNNQRKVAVHRGVMELSKKEALNALLGATQFTILYFNMKTLS